MSSDWRSLVATEYPASQSLLLRYHRALSRLQLQVSVSEEDLAACSIREGARILRLAEYKGVEILVCDESSLMATGTYKDLDACLVSAIARGARMEQVVISSGGNLGYAMSAYGKRSGLRSFFFHPQSTLYKLDAANFDWGGVGLICVDLPERQVKSLSQAFARHYDITHVPDIRWRLAASAVRAMFLLESTHRLEDRVDCIAQVMCAGYGPAGIYNCFSELSREGLVRRMQVPRFLGFQQEANAPMVRAWEQGEREISREHIQFEPQRYIEPGLYNTNPERNYTRLFDLMRYFGGDLLALDGADYQRHSETLLEWFGAAGMELTRVYGGTEVLEKTGLLTGVGILKAIDEGRLRRGERVLYLLTGGLRRIAEQKPPPTPDVVVDGSRTEEEWVRLLGEHFGLRAPEHRRRTDRLVA